MIEKPTDQVNRLAHFWAHKNRKPSKEMLFDKHVKGGRIKLGFYSTVCQGFSVAVAEPLRVPLLNFFTARQRNLGQGNIFTSICHSVQRGWGVLLSSMYHRSHDQRVYLQGVTLPPGGGSTFGGGVCIQGGGQTPPVPPPRYTGYYGMRSRSWRYASYWDAFLCQICILQPLGYSWCRFVLEILLPIAS